ncbi:uncharacterized protein [Argopecten irradians]|uniref:uncharacterized protein n=1 Tax=Argopecten irradians TaxID=31199 RepID=UPI0037165F02
MRFNCSVCGKGFQYRCNLNLHMRVHSGEKPYKCVVCDFRCNFETSLRHHMKKHTGDRQYRCDVCDQRFLNKRALQVHNRIHIYKNPKIYGCGICGKEFTINSSLKRHLRDIHQMIQQPCELPQTTSNSNQQPNNVNLDILVRVLKESIELEEGPKDSENHSDELQSMELTNSSTGNEFQPEDLSKQPTVIRKSARKRTTAHRKRSSDHEEESDNYGVLDKRVVSRSVKSHEKSRSKTKKLIRDFSDEEFSSEKRLQIHCTKPHQEKTDMSTQTAYDEPSCRNLNGSGLLVNLKTEPQEPELESSSSGLEVRIESNSHECGTYTSGVMHGSESNSSGVVPGLESNSSGVVHGSESNSSGVVHGSESNSLYWSNSSVAPGLESNSSGVVHGSESNSSGVVPGLESNSSGVVHGSESNSSGVVPGLESNVLEVCLSWNLIVLELYQDWNLEVLELSQN